MGKEVDGKCYSSTKKCTVRIAFIPWFSYSVDAQPGPPHYDFDYDTCVRPSFLDKLMLNLPLYLAFGEYWNNVENINKKQAEEDIATAYGNIRYCEACVIKGAKTKNTVNCIDIKDQNICQDSGQCEWQGDSEVKCIPKSGPGTWCAESTTLNGQNLYYNDKRSCVAPGESCPEGTTPITQTTTTKNTNTNSTTLFFF